MSHANLLRPALILLEGTAVLTGAALVAVQLDYTNEDVFGRVAVRAGVALLLLAGRHLWQSVIAPPADAPPTMPSPTRRALVGTALAGAGLLLAMWASPAAFALASVVAVLMAMQLLFAQDTETLPALMQGATHAGLLLLGMTTYPLFGLAALAPQLYWPVLLLAAVRTVAELTRQEPGLPAHRLLALGGGLTLAVGLWATAPLVAPAPLALGLLTAGLCGLGLALIALLLQPQGWAPAVFRRALHASPVLQQAACVAGVTDALPLALRGGLLALFIPALIAALCTRR